MAIYRLLQTLSFEPEDIKRIERAYELAVVQLQLTNRNDPLTETVAKIIIEVAQGGVQAPEAICAIALSKMTDTHREAC